MRLHAMLAHRVEQRDRADDVVLVVAQRIRDRFADRLEPGEMDDGVDRVLAENPIERVAVADVRVDECRPTARRSSRCGRAPPRELLARLSTMTGVHPAAITSTQVCEPMKPAPPVSRTILGMGEPSGRRC